MNELRDYQKKCVSELKQSIFAGAKRPIIQLPTGGGKTKIAAAVVRGARNKGNRVIFCVPAISLIDQTVQSFYDEGLTDVGVIQANHPLTDYAKPIQVASIQTLQSRSLGKIPHADVVVVDEAHKLFKFLPRWMAAWNSTPFIGLSATPWTRGLGKYYDDLIVAATTQELIDKNYLSPFRVFAPSHPDLSGVKTVAGDYHEGQLSEAMNQGALVADVVKTWQEHGEDRPTLCFGVDRAHAKSLQARFQAAGVSTGYIDAFTDLEARKAIAKQFHAGEIRVVCNVGCLTTGVDWDVRCIVLCRPTKSEILFTQIIGRGLRTAEGKEDCLILDHSDTHLRLGFVTDIYHEKLDDGKERTASKTERQEPLPKECKSCHFLKPPKVHQCPACGFKPEKQSDVEHIDGELKELRAKRKLNREYSSEEKRSFYGQLKEYGRTMAYKPGWADNKYKEKFGVWPNAHKGAPLVEPTTEVMNWIKHTQIKYAKRRKVA